MKRKLLKSAAFVRAANRLIKRNPQAAADLQATLALLSENAFHSTLKTHKLKGDLADCWACSAGYDLRIVFEFAQSEGAEAILLQSAGTHDEVYQDAITSPVISNCSTVRSHNIRGQHVDSS